jgi:hypothetical protein
MFILGDVMPRSAAVIYSSAKGSIRCSSETAIEPSPSLRLSSLSLSASSSGSGLVSGGSTRSRHLRLSFQSSWNTNSL